MPILSLADNAYCVVLLVGTPCSLCFLSCKGQVPTTFCASSIIKASKRERGCEKQERKQRESHKESTAVCC